MLLFTLFSLCLLTWLSVKVWKYKHLVHIVNKIPGPPTVDLYRKALRVFFSPYLPSDIFQWVTRYLPRKYGPVVRIWALHHPHILISKARCLEQLMKTSNKLPKSNTYQLLDIVIGQSLIVTDGERWHTLRKVMNPGFSYNVLHEFMPVFNKHAVTLARNLAKEAGNLKGFDMLPYSSLCALDIICETSMGVSVNAQSQEASPYVNAVNSLMDYFMNRYMTPWHRSDLIFSFSVPRRTGNKYRVIMYDFADKVIKERREYLNSLKSNSIKQGPKRGMALLDLLLASENEYPKYLQPNDIRNNVNTFIVAGYDTVATATAFILFLLGSHPEIQDKVVEELVEVFGDSGRLPDVTDLANLKYMERCIKESLRLYPSASFFERTNVEDIKIDDYVIPAGCTITSNIFAIHHDPEVYPDPEKFDPDRFLPENCQGRSPYSFIPFSIGARNCIGQKFAMIEEKTLVSTVLRRYRVEAMQDRKELKLKAGIVLRPSNGVHIRISERDAYPNLRVQEHN